MLTLSDCPSINTLTPTALCFLTPRLPVVLLLSLPLRRSGANRKEEEDTPRDGALRLFTSLKVTSPDRMWPQNVSFPPSWRASFLFVNKQLNALVFRAHVFMNK